MVKNGLAGIIDIDISQVRTRRNFD
jgi:hypothetical protein